MCVCVCVCVYVCVCVCVCVANQLPPFCSVITGDTHKTTYIYINIYIHIYMRVCVCVYVFDCVCMRVPDETHRCPISSLDPVAVADLVTSAHRIGVGYGAAAPPGWTLENPTRPFPSELMMGASLLASNGD